MDVSIKPVSETLFQDNHPFYTTIKHITDAKLNVGVAQTIIDSAKIENIPEVGKGGNINVRA